MKFHVYYEPRVNQWRTSMTRELKLIRFVWLKYAKCVQVYPFHVGFYGR